jgi:hypothetical protein
MYVTNIKLVYFLNDRVKYSGQISLLLHSLVVHSL